ncbi:WD40 repeat domain-containing protein [Streptomyces olivochromogenes]|uniref:WD40 repeat domain-containing protein n=1 Tax=Streptomyces olivochromogenes TaxID=1963 RepID=UPI001F22E700|nr:hypothetical protein [Streptomyces olivochromogenes]MCF3132470.1 hypothetical protein [Streptomyces olivochromogenes]
MRLSHIRPHGREEVSSCLHPASYGSRPAYSSPRRPCTLLATASSDGTVRLWNPATHKLIGQLTGHQDAVHAVAFSPDGTLLATAGHDRTVRLWNPATHEPIGQPLTGHQGTILAVAISPDSTLLATAGHDTVRLWTTPATARM